MSAKFNLTPIFAAIVLLLCFPVSLSADDHGAWLSVQANKSFDRTYAFLRLEHRSNHDFSDMEARFLSAGAGLRLAPWLSTDLSYELWDINPGITVHKAVLANTASIARDGLSVSVREKLEFAVNPAAGSTGFTLRSRLKAQYRIPDSIFRPYAMAEVFNWSSWIRSLYYAGTELAIDKHNVFDIFYLYHVPAGAEPVHLVGAGYYFNF